MHPVSGPSQCNRTHLLYEEWCYANDDTTEQHIGQIAEYLTFREQSHPAACSRSMAINSIARGAIMLFFCGSLHFKLLHSCLEDYKLTKLNLSKAKKKRNTMLWNKQTSILCWFSESSLDNQLAIKHQQTKTSNKDRRRRKPKTPLLFFIGGYIGSLSTATSS